MNKQHTVPGKSNKKNIKRKAESAVSSVKDGTISSGSSESRAATPAKEINSANAPNAATSAGRSNRKQTTRPSSPAVSKDAAVATTTTTANADAAKKDESVVVDEAVVIDKEDTQKRTRNSSVSSVATEKSAQIAATVSNNAATTTTSGTSTNADATADTTAAITESERLIDRIEVKIKIPDELKQCLADDWDAITRQHKLLEVPAKITVHDIVEQYKAFKKSTKVPTAGNNANKELSVSDVFSGIIEYFNVMLGSQLLYKFERPQYAEILQRHPETSLSQLYGGFHLLRLFVKLGSMLCFSALEDAQINILVGHLHDFLKFLVKNSATYFSMSNFVNVGLEYHRHNQ